MASTFHWSAEGVAFLPRVHSLPCRSPSLSLSSLFPSSFSLVCCIVGANNDKSGEEKEEGGWEEEKSRMKQKEKKRFDLGKNV
jgi:hypothetical protein